MPHQSVTPAKTRPAPTKALRPKKPGWASQLKRVGAFRPISGAQLPIDAQRRRGAHGIVAWAKSDHLTEGFTEKPIAHLNHPSSRSKDRIVIERLIRHEKE